MRILVIDAGNARVKWAIAEGEALTPAEAHPLRRDPAAAARRIAASVDGPVDGIVVSNVAGPFARNALTRGLARLAAAPPVFVAPAREGYGVRSGYRDPARLGVDRWVALIAAQAAAPGTKLVVDAGTAMTVDVLTGDGRHRGGWILPGPELMARSLDRDTSDIGATTARERPRAGWAAFGRGTDEAVAFGAVYALAGAIERAERLAAGESEAELTRLITGGHAPSLLPLLPPGWIHRPDLVLEGLARMVREGIATGPEA